MGRDARLEPDSIPAGDRRVAVAATTKTVWPLEPHTRAKHEILRRYLEAWSAILSLGGFKTIAYVDGFAGPGLYDNGEDGSPSIWRTARGTSAI